METVAPTTDVYSVARRRLKRHAGASWRQLEGVLDAIEGVMTAMLSKEGPKKAQESEQIEERQ